MANLPNVPYHTHGGIDAPKVPFKDLDNTYEYRVTYNPGSLTDGSGETTDFTTLAARLGDYVLIAAPYDLQGITMTGYVKSTGTTSIRLQNEASATINLASGTWKIKILK